MLHSYGNERRRSVSGRAMVKGEPDDRSNFSLCGGTTLSLPRCRWVWSRYCGYWRRCLSLSHFVLPHKPHVAAIGAPKWSSDPCLVSDRPLPCLSRHHVALVYIKAAQFSRNDKPDGKTFTVVWISAVTFPTQF